MGEYYKCEFLQLKTVSEYDQEIPESQTADKPMTPQGRATQLSLDISKTNQDSHRLEKYLNLECFLEKFLKI